MIAKLDKLYVPVATRIEIQQLKYFIAVAEELNYSKAAEKNYVSQPLLSQQMIALENVLNTKLFERKNRGISLTEAGKVLMIEAKRVVAKTNEILTSIRSLSENQESKKCLHIMNDEMLDVKAFMTAIKKFVNIHSDISIEMKKAPFPKATTEIEQSRFDLLIAFLSAATFCELKSSNTIEIGDDYMEIILPKELYQYSWSKKIEKLKKLPMFVLECDSRSLELSMRLCKVIGLEKCNIVFFQSLEDLILNIKLGEGFAFFPKNVAVAHNFKTASCFDVDEFEEAKIKYYVKWSEGNEYYAKEIARYMRME